MAYRVQKKDTKKRNFILIIAVIIIVGFYLFITTSKANGTTNEDTVIDIVYSPTIDAYETISNDNILYQFNNQDDYSQYLYHCSKVSDETITEDNSISAYPNEIVVFSPFIDVDLSSYSEYLFSQKHIRKLDTQNIDFYNYIAEKIYNELIYIPANEDDNKANDIDTKEYINYVYSNLIEEIYQNMIDNNILVYETRTVETLLVDENNNPILDENGDLIYDIQTYTSDILAVRSDLLDEFGSSPYQTLYEKYLEKGMRVINNDKFTDKELSTLIKTYLRTLDIYILEDKLDFYTLQDDKYVYESFLSLNDIKDYTDFTNNGIIYKNYEDLGSNLSSYLEDKKYCLTLIDKGMGEYYIEFHNPFDYAKLNFYSYINDKDEYKLKETIYFNNVDTLETAVYYDINKYFNLSDSNKVYFDYTVLDADSFKDEILKNKLFYSISDIIKNVTPSKEKPIFFWTKATKYIFDVDFNYLYNDTDKVITIHDNYYKKTYTLNPGDYYSITPELYGKWWFTYDSEGEKNTTETKETTADEK